MHTNLKFPSSSLSPSKPGIAGHDSVGAGTRSAGTYTPTATMATGMASPVMFGGTAGKRKRECEEGAVDVASWRVESTKGVVKEAKANAAAAELTDAEAEVLSKLSSLLTRSDTAVQAVIVKEEDDIVAGMGSAVESGAGSSPSVTLSSTRSNVVSRGMTQSRPNTAQKLPGRAQYAADFGNIYFPGLERDSAQLPGRAEQADFGDIHSPGLAQKADRGAHAGLERDSAKLPGRAQKADFGNIHSPGPVRNIKADRGALPGLERDSAVTPGRVDRQDFGRHPSLHLGGGAIQRSPGHNVDPGVLVDRKETRVVRKDASENMRAREGNPTRNDRAGISTQKVARKGSARHVIPVVRKDDAKVVSAAVTSRDILMKASAGAAALAEGGAGRAPISNDHGGDARDLSQRATSRSSEHDNRHMDSVSEIPKVTQAGKNIHLYEISTFPTAVVPISDASGRVREDNERPNERPNDAFNPTNAHAQVLRTENKWALVRQQNADLKNENEGLRMMNAALEREQEEARRIIERLEKEVAEARAKAKAVVAASAASVSAGGGGGAGASAPAGASHAASANANTSRVVRPAAVRAGGAIMRYGGGQVSAGRATKRRKTGANQYSVEAAKMAMWLHQDGAYSRTAGNGNGDGAGVGDVRR